MESSAPLVVHVVYRFGIGGLENGVVNIINHMPPERYRHAIICATDYTDFVKRITRPDVEVYALNKQPGNDLRAQYRFWKLLRQLTPTIVHTRNMGTIEYVIPALLAGVKHRIHGEHGRDMLDIDGSNQKYIFMRRLYAPFVSRFITMSRDLEQWLIDLVGIPVRKVTQLYNGVDVQRFDSATLYQRGDFGLYKHDFVIGTVGRLQGEKDQATLIKAFSQLHKESSDMASLKLLIIGDGPERSTLEALAADRGVADKVLFLGARDDVASMLGMLDLFVLPSLGEGISNTILEAMASALPVVATRVGGNPELVEHGVTGLLVNAADEQAMADAIAVYLKSPELLIAHGTAGRKVVEDKFSIVAMVNRYMETYDAVQS